MSAGTRRRLAGIAELGGLEFVCRVSGGGGWNETWLAERRGERLAVRLDTPAVSALGLDRAVEMQALRSIQGLGIGLEVVFSDIGRGVLATRWLSGRACAATHLGNPRLLRKLGALFGRLHRTVEAPGGVAPVDLSGATDHYAAIIGGLRARATAREVRRCLKAAGSSLRPPALCHNDPVAKNILRGRSLRLIDWEFSAPGDPLFDLAVVVGDHGLNARQARILLAAARGRAHPSERRALGHLVNGYEGLRLLWEAAAQTAIRQAARARRTCKDRLKDNCRRVSGVGA